jgi:hypothetical protein
MLVNLLHVRCEQCETTQPVDQDAAFGQFADSATWPEGWLTIGELHYCPDCSQRIRSGATGPAVAVA